MHQDIDQDRYASAETERGLVIYDKENGHAWIQSTYYVTYYVERTEEVDG